MVHSDDRARGDNGFEDCTLLMAGNLNNEDSVRTMESRVSAATLTATLGPAEHRPDWTTVLTFRSQRRYEYSATLSPLSDL